MMRIKAVLLRFST